MSSQILRPTFYTINQKKLSFMGRNKIFSLRIVKNLGEKKKEEGGGGRGKGVGGGGAGQKKKNK